ncbi:hypothetical protein PV08_07021 [Exophiala spinifera]|uniref:Heterokaryon incompatibility domain-containing protein n=1 Tax=Exophiala spinifera TaxID=91928 RepID=A0A0D2BSJ6_9EURO|nr:uncharacterized protein PV08_07021 [Exophiala spinifera]KIW14239.1 hypothetical protein PV08_07021 [Exophiala spinifera]
MRLLKYDDRGLLSLTQDLQDDIPPYAILSHTWGFDGDEVTFDDLMSGIYKSKPGYAKIQFCSEQARRAGLLYFWVDTCCINKSNHTELSEAINSIFRWYLNATRCYVHLSDVSMCTEDDQSKRTWKIAFRRSRWFTRGWTLQELIAPPSVEFFSREGELLGSKITLEQQIHEITGIPIAALRGASLSQFSVDERMRWAARRETRRKEDKAYCLMGIFGVFMPLIYGEGENAFIRLLNATRNSYRLDQSHNDGQAFVNSAERPEARNSTLTVKPFETTLRNLGPSCEFSQPDDELSNGETFCYYPLADSTFRLLLLNPGTFGDHITGSLEEYTFEDPPAYYALSYVWGQEPMIHRIVVNGRTKFIQPNLFHALQRIRLRPGPIHVWVDAVCINQTDHSERTMQVRQMATIYRKATSVMVWLGEEDATSRFALDFVPQIISSDFEWVGPWWEQYGFTALAQILERPWFRRGWVFQELAFSTHSTIYCGDRQVYMDHFIMAIDSVRAGLSTMQPSFIQTPNKMRTSILTNFRDSPAVKLLDTIEGAFSKTTKGDVLHRNMSLETLVDLSTFSETTDERDAIYAFLNLANDISSLSEPDQSDSIIPDYGKSILDVFVDFILHCCRQSGSLDIICRPWAPMVSSPVSPIGRKDRSDHSLQTFPSWIASRDSLPFGGPSRRLNHRLHANPLVDRSQRRPYNAHYGLKPHVSVGRNKDGTCDGSLHARGIILGEIAERSTRLANAIVTRECLSILGTISRNPHSSLIDLPDTIWRTLCADRDGKGELAPRFYRVAMLHLLQISFMTPKPGESTNLLDHMSSIDIEELLGNEVADHVKNFLMVVRDVIWNRRTFRTKVNDSAERPLVGLAPQNAKIGDQICIFYGCSVPVVLRRMSDSTDKSHWQLIGNAYVHGVMDGEAIRALSSETLKSTESEIEIR